MCSRLLRPSDSEAAFRQASPTDRTVALLADRSEWPAVFDRLGELAMLSVALVAMTDAVNGVYAPMNRTVTG